MLLAILVCGLWLSAGQQLDQGQDQDQDQDWVDPYDMINYDSSTKTMRRPGEAANFKVESKRVEQPVDSSQAQLDTCTSEVASLQRQTEEQKKKIARMSQQPTCHPVFRRFLSRLLKEIKRIGLPSDYTDVYYDAKIKLSRQSLTEIQTLLEGEDSWRTGALDNAISQILMDLKPHDYEAWKWRFEDSFGVEIETLLKIVLFLLVTTAIVCTQLWSCVSWFVQFKRLFAVCFFVSIAWNWFYLYKIAFAEHQSNTVKLDSVYEKCTGLKKMDWSDSLKEWFRSTLTLQDDPCKKYYEALMVNPVLLVPPTKAISVTITTFLTEPLKHFGQGISEFLRALLKDLPVTLQIPVLLFVMLAIVVVLYTVVNATFQYGISAPLRRHGRGPPELDPAQPQPQMIEARDRLAGGDAPQQAPRRRADAAMLDRNQVRQRPHNRPRERRVETVIAAERSRGEHETDNVQPEGDSEAEDNLSPHSDPEDQQETEDEPAEERADTKPAPAVSPQPKSKPPRVNKKQVRDGLGRDGLGRDNAALQPQPAGGRPSQTRAPDPKASAEDRTLPLSLTHVETVGVPVQETSPVE